MEDDVNTMVTRRIKPEPGNVQCMAHPGEGVPVGAVYCGEGPLDGSWCEALGKGCIFGNIGIIIKIGEIMGERRAVKEQGSAKQEYQGNPVEIRQKRLCFSGHGDGTRWVMR